MSGHCIVIALNCKLQQIHVRGAANLYGIGCEILGIFPGRNIAVIDVQELCFDYLRMTPYMFHIALPEPSTEGKI